MTPKEKAKELVDRYFNEISDVNPMSHFGNTVKQCALICVDEIITCTPSVNGRPPNYQDINKGTKEYWQEVKQEIHKL